MKISGDGKPPIIKDYLYESKAALGLNLVGLLNLLLSRFSGARSTAPDTP